MTFLDKNAILTADDFETRKVDVPEWGGEVLVRGLSGRDRDTYEASTVRFRDNGEAVPELANMRAKLVARCIVDEHGERVFTDTDAGALGNKSAAALNRVWEVAAELSGMTDASEAAIEGNSGAALSGASPSDSPATSDTPE